MSVGYYDDEKEVWVEIDSEAGTETTTSYSESGEEVERKVVQLRRMGRPPVEERKEAQQFMLERQYIDRIGELARLYGITKSALIRGAVIDWLETHKTD